MFRFVPAPRSRATASPSTCTATSRVCRCVMVIASAFGLSALLVAPTHAADAVDTTDMEPLPVALERVHPAWRDFAPQWRSEP